MVLALFFGGGGGRRLKVMMIVVGRDRGDFESGRLGG
jgi:hypothetical protein